MEQFKKWLPRIARRFDLLITAAVGFTISMLLLPLYMFLGRKLDSYLEPLDHYTRFTFLLLTSSFVIVGLKRIGAFRLKDIYSKASLHSKASLCYPPIWLIAFAVGLAFLLFVKAFVLSAHSINQFSYWELISRTFCFFVSGILIVEATLLIIGKLRKKEKPADKAFSDINELLKNPAALIKWIESEEPVVQPVHDVFDYKVVARRVARLFREKTLKTIGIIGPYGCGKSSIIYMVDYYLQNAAELDRHLSEEQKNRLTSDHIICCKVGGWGLNRGTASTHILQTAIAKLAEYVDTTGLYSLPSEYKAALSNVDSKWLKMLGHLLDSKDDPQKVLEKLDEVLCCIEMRLIICIEDIDRNMAGKTFLNEISALLDRIKNLNNVSFILAIEQDRNSAAIFHRIFEHMEVVPSLPRAQVIKIVNIFTEKCLTEFCDDKDLLTIKDRQERMGIESLDYMVYMTLGVEIRTPMEAIIRLMKNPRTAKQALRRTWITWQSLHGEIDFDDLLIANILRYAAPEAFALIYDNVDLLRTLHTNVTENRNDEKNHKFELLWTSCTRDVSWDIDAAKSLINFLFDCWKDNNYYKPQGLRHWSPVDYWVRFNAEEVQEDDRDQKVIHALFDWKNDNSVKISDSLTIPAALYQNEQFALKVKQFGDILDAEGILSLAHDLLDIILKEKRPLKSFVGYLGLTGLQHLSLRKRVPNLDAWLMTEIKRAMCVDLGFAHSLYHYWKIKGPEMNKEFIKAMEETYISNPDLFAEVLETEDSSAIKDIILYIWAKENNHEKHLWIGDLLLKAGNKNPRFAVPQIAVLMNAPSSYDSILSHFPTQFHRQFSELLSKEVEISPSTKEACLSAREKAIKWLSEHPA